MGRLLLLNHDISRPSRRRSSGCITTIKIDTILIEISFSTLADMANRPFSPAGGPRSSNKDCVCHVSGLEPLRVLVSFLIIENIVVPIANRFVDLACKQE
jgi:hypothetical protein